MILKFMVRDKGHWIFAETIKRKLILGAQLNSVHSANKGQIGDECKPLTLTESHHNSIKV